jgi:hypothetical protein
MANICDVRMRIAAKDAKTISDFIEDVRDNGDFRVYSGVFSNYMDEEDFDPSLVQNIDGVCAYDVTFSVAWSFVTAFEDDGVNKMSGKEPAREKFFHEFCKDHGVGIEAYSEESGIGFEEYYVIAPSGQIVVDDVIDMSEEYDEVKGDWIKVGGFGDPDFSTPKEILEATR